MSSNNAVAQTDVAPLIQSVFEKLSALASDEAPTPVELTPAVPIKRSVTDDYIVCLEDGKKLKMLKRHLMTAYDMTPEEYRAKWGLKPDYPMVAPSYAQKRQELAKKIGLGRKPRVVAAPQPRRRPRARAASRRPEPRGSTLRRPSPDRGEGRPASLGSRGRVGSLGQRAESRSSIASPSSSRLPRRRRHAAPISSLLA